MSPKLVVRLKGGLGNQMFQYATARAVASRNGKRLVLDSHSGFVRDRTYNRIFSLGYFDIDGNIASRADYFPFYFERVLGRFSSVENQCVVKRPWGLLIYEIDHKYISLLRSSDLPGGVWLDGYFQSEVYFDDLGADFLGALMPRQPTDPQCLALADGLEADRSVAVGARLYEEARPGTHSVAPASFYEQAANEISKTVANPTFYVFCTRRRLVEGRLKLPGRIEYVTHDDGFAGELPRLWLLSRFKHHIISNSSFYWWGARLAEQLGPGVRVHAHDSFPNAMTIPGRWRRHKTTENEYGGSDVIAG